MYWWGNSYMAEGYGTHGTDIRGQNKVTMLPGNVAYNYFNVQGATVWHWDKMTCQEWLCQVLYRPEEGHDATLTGGIWCKVKGKGLLVKGQRCWKAPLCPLLCYTQAGSATWLLTPNTRILSEWWKREKSQRHLALLERLCNSTLRIYLEKVWYVWGLVERAFKSQVMCCYDTFLRIQLY